MLGTGAPYVSNGSSLIFTFGITFSNMSEKAADGGLSIWAAATHVGD